jgi:hypothetical protein
MARRVGLEIPTFGDQLSGKTAPQPGETDVFAQVGALLDNAAFIQALPDHMPGDETSQARVLLIRERRRELSRA